MGCKIEVREHNRGEEGNLVETITGETESECWKEIIFYGFSSDDYYFVIIMDDNIRENK